MQDTNSSSTHPLVSFIVTTYNLPVDLLCECLDSIISLSLTKEQREIILVDDGSDISPFNDLIKYADDIIYLRQPNQGPSSARNAALRMASGEYIQFVDGDDCLIAPNYEHCLDIVRYRQPVDMVLFYLSASKQQPVDFTFEGPMTGAHYMETQNLRISVCGYIFRADCLGDLRFTSGILHEDEEFMPLLVMRMNHVYTTESKAYYYRVREGSITHSQTAESKAKRLDDTMQILFRLQHSAHECPEAQRKGLERRVAQLSLDYLVKVIRLTRSMRKLNEAISLLAEHGLYPLPNNHYTKKYTLFKRLVENKAGRLLLLAAI